MRTARSLTACGGEGACVAGGTCMTGGMRGRGQAWRGGGMRGGGMLATFSVPLKPSKGMFISPLHKQLPTIVTTWDSREGSSCLSDRLKQTVLLVTCVTLHFNDTQTSRSTKGVLFLYKSDIYCYTYILITHRHQDQLKEFFFYISQTFTVTHFNSLRFLKNKLLIENRRVAVVLYFALGNPKRYSIR